MTQILLPTHTYLYSTYSEIKLIPFFRPILMNDSFVTDVAKKRHTLSIFLCTSIN